VEPLPSILGLRDSDPLPKPVPAAPAGLWLSEFVFEFIAELIAMLLAG